MNCFNSMPTDFVTHFAKKQTKSCIDSLKVYDNSY